MKTAMQELIERAENHPEQTRDFFNWLIKNKTELLEKEKHQIIDAYGEGWQDCEKKRYEQSGEKHYLSTYNP